MKKLLVVATAVAVAFSSCCGGGGSIKTDVDSLAYAIGVDLGTQLKATDSTMNPNIIAKGIIDVFNNRAKMTRDSALQIQQEYFMVKMPAKNLKEGIAYLESVEKGNQNVVKTESGLLYEIVMPGDETMMVHEGDRVKVKYVGRLKEGLKYDPSKEGTIFDQNDEAEFELGGGLIKGWVEGIQHIGKGGKIKLWLPTDLAYGENVRPGGPIAPNVPLFFEVEVIDVTPAEAPVAEEAAN